jgi:bifunctional UDP-N-acetylglucosamine pyrophosphorylase/glucosamine-1-phosphate N-acetyltransferase
VELKLKCGDKIVRLIDKGVDIPNPSTLDIGEEVGIEQISGNGVKIYPGCRIYGKETVISAGSQIGYEGPATIDNCQIGPDVELRGGYFNRAVFFEKARMGLGAHVREGCILEEQSSGAHCVGLKQTILFPFVTLGSLVNFCDCLMAGGTSRKDHSEVGSSYIHFNFTPDGDKATPSLIGDVPRGVMLNQPPIFLGGQGGIVGPVRLGYGNVVAAGGILRGDYPEDNKLIIAKSFRGALIDFVPKNYKSISRTASHNIHYLANLGALEQWYFHVRQQFVNRQEFGDLIYAGALDKLAFAKKERIKRLRAWVDNMSASCGKNRGKGSDAPDKREFCEKIEEICDLFTLKIAANAGVENRDRFMTGFLKHKDNHDDYIGTVKNLPDPVLRQGVFWLDKIVDDIRRQASAIAPSLQLFKNVQTRQVC